MDIRILQVGKKDDNFLVDSQYCPSDARKIREKFLIDEPHETPNIDSLNPWFCEITALYWLLKNTDSEYIGLTHYRTDFFEDSSFKVMGPDTIKKLLDSHDVIAGLWQYYDGKHGKDLIKNLDKWLGYDIDNFMDVLSEHEPGFADFLQEYMLIGHMACNCFIARRSVIEPAFDRLMRIIEYYREVTPRQESNLRSDGWIFEVLLGAILEYGFADIRYSRLVKFSRGLRSVQQQTYLQDK